MLLMNSSFFNVMRCNISAACWKVVKPSGLRRLRFSSQTSTSLLGLRRVNSYAMSDGKFKASKFLFINRPRRAQDVR